MAKGRKSTNITILTQLHGGVADLLTLCKKDIPCKNTCV